MIRKLVALLLIPCLVADPALAQISRPFIRAIALTAISDSELFQREAFAQRLADFSDHVLSRTPRLAEFAFWRQFELEWDSQINPDGTLSINPFNFHLIFAKRTGNRGSSGKPRGAPKTTTRPTVDTSRRNLIVGGGIAGLAALGGAIFHFFSKKQPPPTPLENLTQWAEVVRMQTDRKPQEADQAQKVALEGTKALRKSGDLEWSNHIEPFFTQFISIWRRRPPASDSNASREWLRQINNLIQDFNDQLLIKHQLLMMPYFTSRQGFILGQIQTSELLEVTQQTATGIRTSHVPFYSGTYVDLGDPTAVRINKPMNSFGTHQRPTIFQNIPDQVNAKSDLHELVNDASPTTQRIIAVGNDAGRQALLRALRKDGWLEGTQLKPGFDEAWDHQTILHEVGHCMISTDFGFGGLAGAADEAFVHLTDFHGPLQYTELAYFLFGAAGQIARLRSVHMVQLDIQRPMNSQTYEVGVALRLAALPNFVDLANDIIQLKSEACTTLTDRLMGLPPAHFQAIVNKVRADIGQVLPPVEGTWDFKKISPSKPASATSYVGSRLAWLRGAAKALAGIAGGIAFLIIALKSHAMGLNVAGFEDFGLTSLAASSVLGLARLHRRGFFRLAVTATSIHFLNAQPLPSRPIFFKQSQNIIDAQLGSMMKWAEASRMLLTDPSGPLTVNTMMDANNASQQLAINDPEWAAVSPFFTKLWQLWAQIKRFGLSDDRAFQYITLIQDLNDQVLTQRGWLMRVDTDLKNGFLLARINAYRDVTSIYSNHSEIHREPMRVWIGEDINLASSFAKGSPDEGDHFGRIGRHTLFVDVKKVNTEYSELSGLCDPQSQVSKLSGPTVRETMLEGMKKDGLIRTDASVTGLYHPIPELKEIVESDVIEHEISHAMKATMSGRSANILADEEVAYMTQYAGRMGATRVMKAALNLADEALNKRPWNPLLTSSLRNLATVVDDPALGNAIRQHETRALGRLIQKTLVTDRKMFVALAKKARTNASQNLPGPTDWSVEFGATVKLPSPLPRHAAWLRDMSVWKTIAGIAGGGVVTVLAIKGFALFSQGMTMDVAGFGWWLLVINTLIVLYFKTNWFKPLLAAAGGSPLIPVAERIDSVHDHLFLAQRQGESDSSGQSREERRAEKLSQRKVEKKIRAAGGRMTTRRRWWKLAAGATAAAAAVYELWPTHKGQSTQMPGPKISAPTNPHPSNSLDSTALAEKISAFMDQLIPRLSPLDAYKVRALQDAFNKTPDRFADRGAFIMGIGANLMEPRPDGTYVLRLIPGTFTVYANSQVWKDFFDYLDTPTADGWIARILFESVIIKEAEGLAYNRHNYDQKAAGHYAAIKYSRIVQPAVNDAVSRVNIIRTNPDARDAARTHLAESIAEEVVGYIPEILYLYRNHVTQAAVTEFQSKLEAQGHHDAAITMRNFAATLDLSIIGPSGRVNRRALDLYVLGQIINARGVPDYADIPAEEKAPFTQLGLSTITDDLLNAEGITYWPTPIRPDQLIYLEKPQYYHPPRIVVRPDLQPQGQLFREPAPAGTRLATLRKAAETLAGIAGGLLMTVFLFLQASHPFGQMTTLFGAGLLPLAVGPFLALLFHPRLASARQFLRRTA